MKDSNHHDRLLQIIGDGREAFAMHSDPMRAVLLQRAGGDLRGARALAFDALPEGKRLVLVKSHGAVPAGCGDEVPVGPARGRIATTRPVALYPKGADEWEEKPAGHLGRKGLRMRDGLDSVTLSPGQRSMGRTYATLVEQMEAGGARGVSLETMKTGARGTHEGFTDHRLDLSRRLDVIRARIGNGVAMAVRRVRPSRRGGDGLARRNIRDRDLVDAICLGLPDSHGVARPVTISAVLALHGWAVKGDTVKTATAALAAALDRMAGPVRRVQVVGFRPDGMEPLLPRKKGA